MAGRHPAAPAPPQCRQLPLPPGDPEQPPGAGAALGGRRNSHIWSAAGSAVSPGQQALLGLCARPRSRAGVRRTCDRNHPSAHTQKHHQQPREQAGRAQTAREEIDKTDHRTAPAQTHQEEQTDVGAPEPSGRPPHHSAGPIGRPGHQDDRNTAVPLPCGRSAGSSSPSGRSSAASGSRLKKRETYTITGHPQSASRSAQATIAARTSQTNICGLAEASRSSPECQIPPKKTCWWLAAPPPASLA